MDILVVAASKHSSTAEIADAIAEELSEAGHDVRRTAAAGAALGAAEAVVLGSAVYMSRWMADARAFAANNLRELQRLPLWVFSVGLVGEDADDPRKVERELVAALDPIAAVAFAGRLDESALGLRVWSDDRTSHAPKGDLRNWDAIRGWAREIDAHLAEHLGAR